MDPSRLVSKREDELRQLEEAVALFEAETDAPTSHVAETNLQVRRLDEVIPTSNSDPRVLHDTDNNKPSPERKLHWEPGLMLRTLKQKVDDHAMVKRVRDTASQKLFGSAESPNSKTGTETSDMPGTPTSQNDEGTNGLRGLNHALYNRALDWKNKSRDESKKRTIDAHRQHSLSLDGGDELRSESNYFASLLISHITIENLPSWGKRAPYVVVSIEGNSVSTERAPSKGPYKLNSQLHLTVRDIWADVGITVFAAKPGSEVVAMEDEFVGKGFIPLSSLILANDQPWFRTLFTLQRGGTYYSELSIDFLPLASHTRTYSRCVDGMPSTGLQRPTEPAVRVKLAIEMKTLGPLSRALLLAPPSRRTILPSKGEALNPALLHQRKMRLQQIIADFGASFGMLVDGIISFRNPFATWVWLTLFAQTVLFSPLYHIPFLLAVGTVIGACFVRTSRNAASTSPHQVNVYSDQTELSPEIPQTIPAKVKALQQLASTVQMLLGVTVSILERLYFALSWDDPFISFLVSLLLLAVGFAISFVWMILYEFGITFRIGLFSFGLFLHIPGSYQNAFRTRLARLGRAWKSKFATGEALPMSSATSNEFERESMVEETMNTQNERTDDRTFPEPKLYQSLKATDKLRWAITNLMRRIPDGPEIDHRHIANQTVDLKHHFQST